MPRVTKAKTAKAKHKKVLASTKGHYGARSRLYKTAKQSSIKSLQYSFRDRKVKKRTFRSLWVSRINAAAREEGISYSKFINNIHLKNIKLNRKMLAQLAIDDIKAFKEIVEVSSKA